MEKITNVEDIHFWRGEIPLENVYTAGVAGERFLREIKDAGRILGTRCPACSLVYVPPQIYCGRCFAALDQWVEVGQRGTVHAYTVVHVDLDGHPLAEPAIVALVKLEGADGGLVHRLGEVAPDRVRIGLPVEAVLQAPAERVGSIRDIRYFRPREA